MKRFASAPPRLMMLSLFVLLTFSSSCYKYDTVHPVHAYKEDFDKMSNISVVDREGIRHDFDSGHIRDDFFYGVDESGGTHKIALDDISYFRLKHLNVGKTVGALIGVSAASLLMIGIATASCPEVYCFDGEEWVLDGEPYSGAIAATCERTDYQVLESIKSSDGEYRLIFKCIEEEIEFTDEVKLLTVDADPSIEVIPDGVGGLLAIGSWGRPYEAVSGSGEDVLALMNDSGEFFWEGNPMEDYPPDARPREELYLSFKRPAGQSQARLLLRGNNTVWGMHIMDDVLSRFGQAARTRLAQLNSDPDGRDKVERFMKKNGIWIEVELLESGEWRTVGFIRDVGPNVVRSQALSFTLPESEEDTLKMRLRWGPAFWNLMKVGVDYSAGESLSEFREIEAAEARDRDDGDITALIRDSDDRRYKAEPGDEASLTFPAPPEVPGLRRTVILKAEGYYNLILPAGEEPGLAEVMMELVRKKGLDAHSVEMFRETARQSRQR